MVLQQELQLSWLLMFSSYSFVSFKRFLLLFLEDLMSLFNVEPNFILPLFVSAAYRNLVLLLLTVVMEIVLVCFLLSTLQRLPYQLESKWRQCLILDTFLHCILKSCKSLELNYNGFKILIPLLKPVSLQWPCLLSSQLFVSMELWLH